MVRGLTGSCDARLGIDADFAAGRNPEAESRHGACAFCDVRDGDRQIALDRMDAECGLVAMPLYTPREHAHLVKVERQAGLRRRKHHHILRHRVVRHVRLLIRIFVSTYAPTMRWPSAYCAIESGASMSMRPDSSHPAWPSASRTSHQSSRTSGTGLSRLRNWRGRDRGLGLRRGRRDRRTTRRIPLCRSLRDTRSTRPMVRRRCSRGCLRHRRPRQQFQFGVGRQQPEAFGVPPRRQVQVHVIAKHGGGHHGILLVLVGKLRKCVVELAVDHRVFFDPPDLVLLRLYLEEAAAVFQHLERLPVGHLADAIRNRRHPIMQIHLPRRHVDRVMLLVMKLFAAAYHDDGKEGEPAKDRSRGSMKCSGKRQLKAREHSRNLL